MNSVAMPLERARHWAALVVSELAPLCHRIEVAGSIRRGRPVCNDIDLVLIPKDLEAVKRRCLASRGSHAITHGDCNLSFALANGVQLDLFTAWPEERELLSFRPTNWGSVLLCRTGSKEHNVRICNAARENGWHWDPTRGLMNARKEIIAGETEESIFKALGLEFVRPERREA